MKLQQLRYILEIADCHSITRASKKLFVSQPYLSKVISEFEAELRQPIFIRYNNGVELTECGKKVYLLAQSIINQMELLDSLGKEPLPKKTSVMLSFSVGNLILKDSLLLDYFSASHAVGNNMDFYETTIEECVQNVEKDVSEFAIIVVDDFQKILLSGAAARKNLMCIELDEGYPYYHLHRNHTLANQDHIRPDTLAQYPFVRLKTDEYAAFSREKLKETCPEIYWRKCISVNHYHSYLSLVKNKSAFMIGNKWQISELEKMGIQSIRFSSSSLKVHLEIVKKELPPFSFEAKRFLHLFKDSYGLDKKI